MKNKRYLNFSEFYYIVFTLGTDLLKDKLNWCDGVDACFKQCEQIAKDFTNSQYNINSKSLYSCLEEYSKTQALL